MVTPSWPPAQARGDHSAARAALHKEPGALFVAHLIHWPEMSHSLPLSFRFSFCEKWDLLGRRGSGSLWHRFAAPRGGQCWGCEVEGGEGGPSELNLNLQTARGLARELGLSCRLLPGRRGSFHKYLSDALCAGPASTSATEPPLWGPRCPLQTESFCQAHMGLSPREPQRVWG